MEWEAQSKKFPRHLDQGKKNDAIESKVAFWFLDKNWIFCLDYLLCLPETAESFENTNQVARTSNFCPGFVLVLSNISENNFRFCLFAQEV